MSYSLLLNLHLGRLPFNNHMSERRHRVDIVVRFVVVHIKFRASWWRMKRPLYPLSRLILSDIKSLTTLLFGHIAVNQASNKPKLLPEPLLKVNITPTVPLTPTITNLFTQLNTPLQRMHNLQQSLFLLLVLFHYQK